MIAVTLQYEGRTLPEKCSIEELYLIKHLVRFSLNKTLNAATLTQGETLVHLDSVHIENLRNHGLTLMSSRGFTVPVLGSSLRKEAASA